MIQKLSSFTLSLFVLFFFLSCVQKETKISSSSFLNKKNQFEHVSFKKESVVIDARNFFEYKVSHFPGSFHENWRNFFSWRKQNAFLRVKSDLKLEIRNFFRLSIHPDSPIVIYGNGKKGKGDEWALAWVFLYLNFKSIQVVSVEKMKKIDSFINEVLGFKVSDQKPSKKPFKKFWVPKYNERLISDPGEMESLFDFKSGLLNFKSGFKKKHKKKSTRIWFLNVTQVSDEGFSIFKKTKNHWVGEKEFQKRVIHLSWGDFLNSKGEISKKFKRKLLKHRVMEQDRVVVLGSKPVEVLAMTSALYFMGFRNVSSFSERKEVFLNQMRKKINSMKMR